MFLSSWKNSIIDFSTENSLVVLDLDAWKRIIKYFKTRKMKNIGLKGYREDIQDICIELENKDIDFYFIGFPNTNLINLSKQFKKDIYYELSFSDLNSDFLKKTTLYKENVILVIELTKEDLINTPSEIITILKQNIVGFKGLIIRLSNYCDICTSYFWKNRRPVISGIGFSINQREKLRQLSSLFKKNIKELKIKNSKIYLSNIPDFGITQNWNCKHFDNPTIHCDGGISPCRQRNFINPFSIYSLIDGDEKKLLKISIETSKCCEGCFQVEKIDGECFNG